MDDLHCNRLTCRRVLTDKAVVTTCSHIFCVECANEIFSTTTLICAACDTTLDQPDDVVICSLHPTNDYKTVQRNAFFFRSMMWADEVRYAAGNRASEALPFKSDHGTSNSATSFWQYQIHQESSFQQAVLRNVNERNAQMQKQLENVVREANSELSLLNNKLAVYERDLELERRKCRDLMESAKEKDVEYQKLKNQLDRMKRKALLGPGGLSTNVRDNALSHNAASSALGESRHSNNAIGRGGSAATSGLTHGAENAMASVVSEMEANKIQRTPIRQNATSSVTPWASTNEDPLSSRPHPQAFSAQYQETLAAGAPQFSASQRPANLSPNSPRNFQYQQRSHRTHRSEGMSDSSSGTEMAGGHERIRESRHATHSAQHPQANAYIPHDRSHQNAFLRGPGGLVGSNKARASHKQIFAQPMPKRTSAGFKPATIT